MENSENKNEVRAWLYQLLAELEIMPDVEGHRTELGGNHIIIDLQFKG